MGGWWCKDLLGKEKQYISHVDCGKVGQVGRVVTWGWEQEGLGSGACEHVCACARGGELSISMNIKIENRECG